MADEVLKSQYRFIKGAKVHWPADMPDDMLQDAIATSKRALEEYNVEKEGNEITKSIKEHFDEQWEPFWHVFLGKSFGCHSVHETNRFCYFTFESNNYSFLIYKAN